MAASARTAPGQSGSVVLRGGQHTIGSIGSGLTLCGPTAGTVFDLNPRSGKHGSLTAGTLRDGQSAFGLRLFDAPALDDDAIGFVGGFALSEV